MKFPEMKDIRAAKVKKIIGSRGPNKRSKRERDAVQARLVVQRAFGEGLNWPEMEVWFGVPAATLRNLVEPGHVDLPTEETTTAVIEAARLHSEDKIRLLKAEIRRLRETAKLDSIKRTTKRLEVERASRIMEDLGGKKRKPASETNLRRRTNAKAKAEAKLAGELMKDMAGRSYVRG
jgi:hypothetical protein